MIDTQDIKIIIFFFIYRTNQYVGAVEIFHRRDGQNQKNYWNPSNNFL